MELQVQGLKNILIIDDQEDVLDTLTEILSMLVPNATLITAPDGSLGYQKLTRQKFDLIITDLNMPKVDGASLIKSIKNLPKDQHPARILILSGFLEDAREQSKIGEITFIPKPIKIAVIRNYIQVAFGKHQEEEKLSKSFFKIFHEQFEHFFSSTAQIEVSFNDIDITNEKINAPHSINCFSTVKTDLFRGNMILSMPPQQFTAAIDNMSLTDTSDEEACLQSLTDFVSQYLSHMRLEIGKKGKDFIYSTPIAASGKVVISGKIRKTVSMKFVTGDNELSLLLQLK